MWNCGGAGITRARVPRTWRLPCVFGAERGTEEKGCKGSADCFGLSGICEGELFGILGTTTKIAGVVQSKENVAANTDVPSAPFCIAALLVTIAVAWR